MAGFVCHMVPHRIPGSICNSVTTAETCFSTPENWRSFKVIICYDPHLPLDQKINSVAGEGSQWRCSKKKIVADTVTAKLMTELSKVLHTNFIQNCMTICLNLQLSNPLVSLVKCFNGCHVKIRIHHAVKHTTIKITRPNICKELMKLMIFNHK